MTKRRIAAITLGLALVATVLSLSYLRITSGQRAQDNQQEQTARIQQHRQRGLANVGELHALGTNHSFDTERTSLRLSRLAQMQAAYDPDAARSRAEGQLDKLDAQIAEAHSPADKERLEEFAIVAEEIFRKRGVL